MSPTPPPSYPADAACATSDLPPGTWDHEVAGETDQQRKARVTTAKAICADCPVTVACLRHLVDGGGIRAGREYTDKIPGYRGDLYLPVSDHGGSTGCGTEAGYQQHHKDRTPKCGPCKMAHSSRVAEGITARKRARRAAA